jgi:hypothetical protein
MTVYVRWPARPAELRAGLDFFFVILADYLFASRQKVDKGCGNNSCIKFYWDGQKKKITNENLQPIH